MMGRRRAESKLVEDSVRRLDMMGCRRDVQVGGGPRTGEGMGAGAGVVVV